MFNQTSDNNAYYSEKNDKSAFRFVRMTASKADSEKYVEHKCGTCGSVQISEGYTHNLPNGFVRAICGDCAEKETNPISFCVSCDTEIADINHYDTYEVPDDWDFPKTMNHYNSICTTCMEDTPVFDPENPFKIREDDTMTVSNETPIFDSPKDPEAAASEKRLDEAFQRLDDKLAALQNYFEGRNALFQDHRNGEITMEEVEAGLERLRSRLK